MSGPHLGARVTPLVDGRLAADVAARAHEHARACSECSQAVESERLLRARVQSLGIPEVSADLMTRLIGIGGPSGPLPPRDGRMSQPARPVVGIAPPSRGDLATRAGAGRPAGRPLGRSRRRPVAVGLAGTFSLLGAGIVGVLVLGGGLQGGSTPAPVAELRTTPSASSTLPGGSPSVSATPLVWSAPSISSPAFSSPVNTSPSGSSPSVAPGSSTRLVPRPAAARATTSPTLPTHTTTAP